MENVKINVAELLKDCPQGMELDSPVWNNIIFEEIDEDNIIIYRKSIDAKVYLTQYGEVNSIDGKCIIFPKGKTTWEGFQRPFMDGDIAVSDRGDIHLLRTKDSSYCAYRERWEGQSRFDKTITTRVRVVRFATKEEKAKLFQAIKENGYKWNPETKTLEKLIEPKFKVGDRIKWIKTGNIYEIIKIISDCYIANYLGSDITILWNRQDEYELVPDKFDINALIPFESRVLVRGSDPHSEWKPAIFGVYKEDKPNGFYVVGGNCWRQCIPYEGNEHLIGTTNNCDKYFKTWK